MRRSCRLSLLALVLAGVLAASQATAGASTDISSTYTWKPLKIGGAGWVVGSWVHPNVQDLVYCRTDVGGAYRWDAASGKWIQIVTAQGVPDPEGNGHYGSLCCGTEWSGVDSLVGAPSDGNVAYMAKPYNPGGQGYVYRSTNKGDTWVLPSLQTWSMQENGDYRMFGERLAVDPANANVVYYGSVSQGLWGSTDGGASWSQVTAISGTANVQCVVFDPTSGTTGGRTNKVYAGLNTGGVYRSTNAGASWSSISGPSAITDMEVASDGTLFVAASGVSKYTGSWTSIGSGGEDIAVDPFNPQRIVKIASGCDVSLTTNGGSSWTALDVYAQSDVLWQHEYYQGRLWNGQAVKPWYSIGEIDFDPFVQGKLWFSEGFGCWQAAVPTSGNVLTWVSNSQGIEELCATDVICPPGGKPLSCGMDLGTFYHQNPDQYNALRAFQHQAQPSLDYNAMSHGWSLDYCVSQPSFVVCMQEYNRDDVSGYSTDGGQTWTKFGTMPSDATGFTPRGIAVSATNPDNLVYFNPGANKAWYTTNRGGRWSSGGSLGTAFVPSWGPGDEALTSDKVNGGTFYVYNWSDDANGGIWRSTNGGSSWTHVHTSAYGWLPNAIPPTCIGDLEATPGKAGHVWFCGSIIGDNTFGPLYRSTDGGAMWAAVPNTDWAQGIGFGKAADGASYPTIFFCGRVEGVEGVWRSTDNAQSWALIAAGGPMGLYGKSGQVAGDPDVFGKVYMGTSGTGFAYGMITGSGGNVAPVANNDSYSTLQDVTLNVGVPGVLANDSDANGDALTAVKVANPSHGSVTLSSNGSFAYTPTAGYTGADSFTYKAYDGALYSAVATVSISVAAAPAMHVDSITCSKVRSANKWKGRAVVVIKDASGAAVPNATVTGTFSGSYSQTLSATTDTTGTATLTTTNSVSGTVTFTFCVDNVTHSSYAYDPNANVETCDSYSG